MTVTTATVSQIASGFYFTTPDGVIASLSLSSTGTGAAVWQNGVLSYAEPYLAGDSYGYLGGISDTGAAVGSTTTNSTSYAVSHGVIWQNGAAVSLGSLGSGFTTATAINDSGEVVGLSYVTNTDERAFMWQNGVMTALVSLAGTAAPNGSASAINNQGEIVGESSFVTSTGLLFERATLWQNGQPVDLGALPDGSGNSYAVAINNEGQAIGQVSPTLPSPSAPEQAVLFQNGAVTLLTGLAANESTVARGINDAGTIVGLAGTATGDEHAVMWQAGVITDLNSLLPANSGWVLEEADGVDANGDIFGIGALNGVRAEFLLTPGGSSTSTSLSISASAPNMTITGTAGEASTVSFSGKAGDYAISVSGSTVIVTDTGTGRTSTDHLSDVTAIHFSDTTDIIAATPGSNTVTTGNVTEIYAAVFGRLPDVGGLVYYQNYLTANPSTPLVQFAEWFLGSPEYTAAHNYAQSSAGDAQFITDSYENLLHRTPSAGEVTYYANLIDKFTANLTPGTAAYAAAQTVGHAWVLNYFSASTEFLGDVQVTAQAPSSAQHWLVLT